MIQEDDLQSQHCGSIGRRRDRGKSGLADTFTALNRIDSREMTYVSLSLKKRQLPAPHFSVVSAALYSVCWLLELNGKSHFLHRLMFKRDPSAIDCNYNRF